MNKNNTKKELLEHIRMLEHVIETNKANNAVRQLNHAQMVSRIESEIKKYLYNHNYISGKKTCDQQEELSQERAECIVNKIISVIEEGKDG